MLDETESIIEEDSKCKLVIQSRLRANSDYSDTTIGTINITDKLNDNVSNLQNLTVGQNKCE